jgi:hypothetical protein
VARRALSVKTVNVRGTIGNLVAADPRARAAMRTVVADAGGREHQRAADLTPKLTFFSVQRLRLDFIRDNLGYEIGWKQTDYAAAGRSWYVPYFVFGTSRQAAQDPLTPAQREIAPYFRATLARALRQALARKGAGA